MELSTTFRRRVGAGTDPVLGSDVLPTGLPKVGDAVDNLGTIARCIHSTVMDNPVQRIALFYHYTGAGPAPAVVVTPYCYVRETNSWYQLGIAVTLANDSVGFIDSIAGILPMRTMQPMDTGDTLDSLEVVLLAALPAGAPDGLYDFGAVFDSSLDGSDTAHVAPLPPNASTEATLGKILWGQAGSTAPTAVADTDGIKVSIATPVAPTVYSGAGLNGANVAVGALTAPHNATVTTAVHAATYKTGAPNAIVVTGTEYYTKLPVSEALVLTAAGGGETISGVVLFDSAALSIAVPAQNDALGAFQFGTGTSAPGTQHVIDTAAEAVLGTTADAKVDTDVVGTISSKLRGLVSLILSMFNALKGCDHSEVVTPGDATVVAYRSITCVTAGNLVVKCTSDAAATTIPMTAGQNKSDYNIVRVMAATTGTYVAGW